MRKPSERPEDTRERMLDAAEDLFARHGFDATPTARIAKQAGVPKGLLFYYFPKKIDILLALLAERMPTEPLRQRADVIVYGDVARSLLRLAERLDLGNHESVVLRTIIWREAATHPEVAGYLRRLYEGLLEGTIDVIARATDTTGEVPSGRRAAAATAWVGTMLLAANASRSGGPDPDLVAVARFVADGLRPAPAG